MERNIQLEGATNFRDLGGYEASEGSKIRKGLIYRSDHLSNLTSSDFNVLNKLGIKTVCDFTFAAFFRRCPYLQVQNTC